MKYYPLFADADAGIYPHAAASQYHARPKAKRGVAMLSVDKFSDPRKQTKGNEFTPCSNNICDILKRFRSFKISAITLIFPKSPYKHSVTCSYRSGKESRTAVRIAIVLSSMTFLCLYISRWWRQTWDTPPYFTVVNQSEARISTEHGINHAITSVQYIIILQRIILRLEVVRITTIIFHGQIIVRKPASIIYILHSLIQ